MSVFDEPQDKPSPLMNSGTVYALTLTHLNESPEHHIKKIEIRSFGRDLVTDACIDRGHRAGGIALPAPWAAVSA